MGPGALRLIGAPAVAAAADADAPLLGQQPCPLAVPLRLPQRPGLPFRLMPAKRLVQARLQLVLFGRERGDPGFQRATALLLRVDGAAVLPAARLQVEQQPLLKRRAQGVGQQRPEGRDDAVAVPVLEPLLPDGTQRGFGAQGAHGLFGGGVALLQQRLQPLAQGIAAGQVVRHAVEHVAGAALQHAVRVVQPSQHPGGLAPQVLGVEAQAQQQLMRFGSQLPEATATGWRRRLGLGGVFGARVWRRHGRPQVVRPCY
jgi:hypothetical protein